MAAAPSRFDQARADTGAPRASCSVSLIRSLLSRANPSSAANGTARLVLPEPGAPETSTTRRPTDSTGSAQPMGDVEGTAWGTHRVSAADGGRRGNGLGNPPGQRSR